MFGSGGGAGSLQAAASLEVGPRRLRVCILCFVVAHWQWRRPRWRPAGGGVPRYEHGRGPELLLLVCMVEDMFGSGGGSGGSLQAASSPEEV